MNIQLKTLLIFCLMAATAAQTTTGVPSTSTAASTDTSASTASVTTDTTKDTTGVPSTSTAVSTGTSASTASVTTDVTTDTTKATGNTDTTTGSTGNTPASTTAATTTTTTQGPCASSPCIGDSTCEERFGGLFACICRPGLVYSEMRGCFQTKVFLGSLSLNRTFIEDMANKMSEAFLKTAAEIEEALRRVLGNGDNGYINSTVLALRSGSIVADVQNFYELSSNATSDSVNAMISKDIQIPDFQRFTSRSVCEDEFCDSTTTTCTEMQAGIAECTCRKEYIKSQFTSQACLACPNGERATANSESCEKCPFGFAGFNCNDPYLLVVVVVSTVSGALLIIFIVALIVVSCRSEKESSSSQVDFSSSYGNNELHKPTGVPRIPRANPDANWKSNTLEMSDSGSYQALVTKGRPESKARYNDYDDDMSHRGQIPPAGVENGGAHNPYFRQDDDRIHRY